MTDSPKRPDSREARSRRGPTHIGEWVLHPDIGVLRGHAGEVRLNPKTLHVLLVLLDAGDQGVSREALLDQVWGESYPSDSVISRAMADLRAAFGEKAGEQKYIRTLPKFGYQFVARHHPVDKSSTATEDRVAIDQQRKPLWYVGLAVALLALAWFGLDFRQTDYSPASSIAILGQQRPLTSAPGLEHQPRFVPGNEWVVHAVMRPDRNDWDLFRVSVSDGILQPVAVTPGVHEHGPAISTIGDELAYVRLAQDQCDIVVQSITLGVPEVLATCTTKFPTLVDWSPAESALAYTISQRTEKDGLRRIYLVDRFTGDTRQLTRDVSDTGTDFYPRFSPSGSKLAFLRGEPQPDHRTTLWVIDVVTHEETQLTKLPTQMGGMSWLDENRIIYSIDDGGRMQGRWLDLVSGVSHPFQSAEFVHPEYSLYDNSLIAAQPRTDSDLTILEAGKDARVVARSTGDDHHGSLSPDEQWIAFISQRSGYDELWIAQTNGDLSRQLTRFDGAAVRYPDWHPDGQRILFTVQTDGGEKLYEVDIVSGTPKIVETGFVDVTLPRWLPDASGWIAGCLDESGWGICVSAGVEIRRLADSFYRPRPSADGAVYVVNDAGTLFSLSLTDGTTTELWDGLPGNGRYAWAIENGALYFLEGGESGNASRMMHRDIKSGDMKLLHEGAMPIADINLSIGRRTGAVLFTSLQTSSDDIVLYRAPDFD